MRSKGQKTVQGNGGGKKDGERRVSIKSLMADMRGEHENKGWKTTRGDIDGKKDGERRESIKRLMPVAADLS